MDLDKVVSRRGVDLTTQRYIFICAGNNVGLIPRETLCRDRFGLLLFRLLLECRIIFHNHDRPDTPREEESRCIHYATFFTASRLQRRINVASIDLLAILQRNPQL